MQVDSEDNNNNNNNNNNKTHPVVVKVGRDDETAYYLNNEIDLLEFLQQQEDCRNCIPEVELWFAAEETDGYSTVVVQTPLGIALDRYVNIRFDSQKGLGK